MPVTESSTTNDRQDHALWIDINDYYRGREHHTPYGTSAIHRGRELVESLCEYETLNVQNNQRWLLWELLGTATEHEYQCTVELRIRRTARAAHTLLHLLVFDEWLEEPYTLDIPLMDVRQSIWQAHFDKAHFDPCCEKVEVQAADQFLSSQECYRSVNGNPYQRDAQTSKLLKSLTRTLKDISAGEAGSFVYDLQHIMMQGARRDLWATLGFEDTRDCFYLGGPGSACHAQTPKLTVELYDGFFHSLKRTCICSNHLKQYLLGKVNLLSPEVEFALGSK
jgi:hypothetical protein